MGNETYERGLALRKEVLGAEYVEIAQLLPGLHVLGGCCGTDTRHVAAIADSWVARAASVGDPHGDR